MQCNSTMVKKSTTAPFYRLSPLLGAGDNVAVVVFDDEVKDYQKNKD